MRIQVYKKHHETPNFYLQSHGYNAGRVLKDPIANCFGVYTDQPIMIYIFEDLYNRDFYKRNHLIIGSVIPFIRISDLKRKLRPLMNAKAGQIIHL